MKTPIPMQTTFAPETYNHITLDELVTYCVFILQEGKREATFEDIVAKCFELFPNKFSLAGYPQWPDSARVNKSWLRCRTDFKYIKGSVKGGFKVTSKGLDIVESVQNRLDRPLPEKFIVKQRKSKERTREEQFIGELEKSDVFQRYLVHREQTDISHYEFCDMLYCTLESSAEALRENLDRLKGYAKKFNKSDVFNFLSFAEKKYSHLLRGKVIDEYSGGMNKRKSRRDNNGRDS